ncbi:MAG: OB-fold domain-containing protein, partial [Dehalococcoidia bacterium]
GSLRSGTQALKLALDGVRAGSFRNALVIATDHRQGPPGSDIERDGGDAAVALLVGAAAPAVEVTATYSVVNDILDVWRGSGERLLRSTPEEHFRYEEGYLHAIKAGLEGLGAVAKRGGGDFQRVALYSPDSRRRAEAVRRLGLDAARVIESPAGAGSSGVAHALLQLVSALDVAGADEEILVLNYGDGCDALALRTTAALATSRHGRTPLASQLARAVPIADYYDFLRWRGLGPVSLDGARTAPAPHAVYREQDEVIRLHGMRCNACEMVQYPAQRVCVRCKAKDNNTTVAMADGGATLFSYSLDYVAATPDVPLLHGVVDFDIGGRAMMMVTDRDLESVAIGMKLDLTFRKFLEADGVSAYLWKAAPAR